MYFSPVILLCRFIYYLDIIRFGIKLRTFIPNNPAINIFRMSVGIKNNTQAVKDVIKSFDVIIL